MPDKETIEQIKKLKEISEEKPVRIPKITDKDTEGMSYKEKQQFYKHRSNLCVARKSTHTLRKVY